MITSIGPAFYRGFFPANQGDEKTFKMEKRLGGRKPAPIEAVM